MKMSKPEISDRFDLEDIRAIRDHNSMRHNDMTPEEIVADTKAGAARVMRDIKNRTANNNVKVVSCESQAYADAPVS